VSGVFFPKIADGTARGNPPRRGAAARLEELADALA